MYAQYLRVHKNRKEKVESIASATLGGKLEIISVFVALICFVMFLIVNSKKNRMKAELKKLKFILMREVMHPQNDADARSDNNQKIRKRENYMQEKLKLQIGEFEKKIKKLKLLRGLCIVLLLVSIVCIFIAPMFMPPEEHSAISPIMQEGTPVYVEATLLVPLEAIYFDNSVSDEKYYMAKERDGSVVIILLNTSMLQNKDVKQLIGYSESQWYKETAEKYEAASKYPTENGFKTEHEQFKKIQPPVDMPNPGPITFYGRWQRLPEEIDDLKLPYDIEVATRLTDNIRGTAYISGKLEPEKKDASVVRYAFYLISSFFLAACIVLTVLTNKKRKEKSTTERELSQIIRREQKAAEQN